MYGSVVGTRTTVFAVNPHFELDDSEWSSLFHLTPLLCLARSVFEFVINVILILILIFHLSFYFNEFFFHFRMIRPNEHIVVKTCTLNGLLLQNKSIDPKVCPCICVYACVCV